MRQLLEKARAHIGIEAGRNLTVVTSATLIRREFASTSRAIMLRDR